MKNSDVEKDTGELGTILQITVNGRGYRVLIEPQWTLSFVLRDKLGLTGTKIACDQGACGACTVIMDGRPILSCMTLAIDCQGKSIQTIEGVASENHPILDAWVNTESVQCGYCTPGAIMNAKALLDRNPNPNEEEIRDALSGNICRCGTYPRWVNAVKAAAQGGKND